MNPSHTLSTAKSESALGLSLAAIMTFIVLTFVWSWGLGFLANVTRATSPLLNTALIMIAGYGPSLAGLAVMLMFGTGTSIHVWLGRCVNWRVDWRWFALAFVFPPVVMVLALGLHIGSGGALPAFPAAAHIQLAIANFGFVLLIGGPLGEEFGWRGYLTPALRSWMDWRAASLIVGVIWGLWHLPLFFMAETAQAHMPIAVFMINILAGSVLFGWLFERSQGSVLPAIVAHTSLNTWAGLLGIVPTPQSGQPYAIVTGLLVMIALALLLMPNWNQTLAACVRK
jgi:uncharacterized protein